MKRKPTKKRDTHTSQYSTAVCVTPKAKERFKAHAKAKRQTIGAAMEVLSESLPSTDSGEGA